MSRFDLLTELRAYVGFDEDDVALIVEARPALEPAFPAVIDAFYVAIEARPRARAVFKDGAQIERQKTMLGTWLRGIFVGVYDEAYFESRVRVGYAHVRIGLDPSLMLAGMNIIRTELHAAVRQNIGGASWPASRRERLHTAIDRICDIDSAIMLDTYADDSAVRIRSAEKLAALGRIAGTIGHELRNPLAVMETSLYLLDSSVPKEPKIVRHLERLRAQVVLCSSIVRDLMDLARDREPNRESTRIADVIAEALQSLPLGDGVRVSIEPANLVASVDPIQFRQLVVNLVTNALQAASSPEGVYVGVVYAGEELEIRVDDDGAGIPDEVWPRLFEPLFTTRSRGAGFGLALCRRIAERHGGHIRAMNREGGGARFEARLRCHSEKRDEPQSPHRR